MVIMVEFDKFAPLFFDLSKQESAIYQGLAKAAIKEYKAPFDAMLFKRFSGANVVQIYCEENNRILRISAELASSYKALKSELVLEFTGRFTNAIIIDEKGIILAALRHIDNSQRKISSGVKFVPLLPAVIKEKATDRIEDFWAFFKSEFERLNEKNLRSLRQIKMASVEKKIELLKHSLEALPKQRELENESENAAKIASLILANLSNLPPYASEVSLADFEGHELKITLTKPPKQEANTLFEASKRLRAKANGVKKEIENLNEKINFYQNLLNLIKNATSVGELEVLLPRKSAAKKAPKEPNENIKNFYIADVKISVGRNQNANSELLKIAKKNDIWLHVKDHPSAHVIIKTQKASVSEEILGFAAKICVSFSSLGAGRYEVDYTKRENVKIQNGSNVKYINFKTIIVKI
ncbi:hypothetical protein LBC_08680 [Campylobacter sp. 19-13652]|nr:hypothetical protein LBC_08680 [Campylobacter sp. 19-13652]